MRRVGVASSCRSVGYRRSLPIFIILSRARHARHCNSTAGWPHTSLILTTCRNINFAFRRLSAMPENVVRELAEKGPAYTKDTYAKTQAAAGETTKFMQQTYAAASKGAADFNLHLI